MKVINNERNDKPRENEKIMSKAKIEEWRNKMKWRNISNNGVKKESDNYHQNEMKCRNENNVVMT